MKDHKEEKQKLRRYLDDMYVQEEAAELLDSLRRDENKELLNELASNIWEESSLHRQNTNTEHDTYKKEAYRLLQKLEHHKRFHFRHITYAIASIAALLCLIFGSIHYSRYIEKKSIVFTQAGTTFGEKKQLTLPDGSRIVLNSCSSLRYPNKFIGKTRTVELDGEAYFEIAHNEKMPFIVSTCNFNVRVLGTQFDVKAYRQDEMVSEYNKKNEEKEVAVWIKGSLRFNHTPIRDVARELERMYNCRISFAEDQEFNNLISGEHDNQSLESVLESIRYISGVKNRKEGDRIILYK